MCSFPLIETLRFLRLNERNFSLVAIGAVILVMQRLSSEATTYPDTMMRKVHQRADISGFFFQGGGAKMLRRHLNFRNDVT